MMMRFPDHKSLCDKFQSDIQPAVLLMLFFVCVIFFCFLSNPSIQSLIYKSTNILQEKQLGQLSAWFLERRMKHLGI